MIKAIVAIDEERGIGKDGTLAWRIPEDLKRFSALTTGHTVLMGRKTYDSLPLKFKPLPNRKNIVVTRNAESLKEQSANIEVVSDLDKYLNDFKDNNQDKVLWIIGGAEIYALTKPYWDEVYLTKVDGSYNCDTFLPEFEENFKLVESIQKEGYSFINYKRVTDMRP